MAMYMCKYCDKPISGWKKHVCNPKPEPYNVVMTEEDKKKLNR